MKSYVGHLGKGREPMKLNRVISKPEFRQHIRYQVFERISRVISFYRSPFLDTECLDQLYLTEDLFCENPPF